MSYLTPAQLVQGQGALLEIAQLYELVPELLTATIAATDRSEWSAEQIAAADEALASIVVKIVEASSEVDSYLIVRGYSLPLSAEQFPVLRTWTRMVVRYHIQQQRDKTNEYSGRIERDYTEARKDLKSLAAGERGLGADDPLLVKATPVMDSVVVDSEERLFSRRKLRGL